VAPDHRRRERQQRSKPITEALAVWAYAVLDSRTTGGLTGQDASAIQAQGRSSSRRLLGQLLTSLVNTSVKCEVRLRIDAVRLAGLDQRGEHRPIFRSFVKEAV
jgi:hypothetical protein